MLALGTGVALPTGWASAAGKTPTTPSKFAIELGGIHAGWVVNVEGGGGVISEKGAAFKYEEISFMCGTGMSKALFDWVNTGLRSEGGRGREDGAILFADFDDAELSRLTFQQAIISELCMPALDTASKDAAKMTIKFRPEQIQSVPGLGKFIKPSLPVKETPWRASEFRLKIDGLEEPCSRVRKIEAITIKKKTSEDAFINQWSEPVVQSANIVLTIDEPDADAFFAMGARPGAITYLAADRVTPLFTLVLKSLKPFRVAPDKMEAGAEGIRRVKAEMYCEEIRFSYSAAATFG